MTPEEKLEVYRKIILQLDTHRKLGYLKMSSCRILDSINFDRLVKDSEAAINDGHERETIGLGIYLTAEEHKELKDEINGTTRKG